MLKVADPNFAERTRASFARQAIMQLLGAEMREVEAGRVLIALPFKPELTQQHGFFHGGATATIADSAGGYAGFTLFGPGESVLTVEFKLNLIAPADGDCLYAEGRVKKPGRTPLLPLQSRPGLALISLRCRTPWLLAIVDG